MKNLIFIVLFFMILIPKLTADEIILGVVPQQSPQKLMKVWQPIVKYLSEKIGHTVILKVEFSIPEFEKVLYSGGYDFAYMNPYHYVEASNKKGYEAKIRAQKNIVGILVSKESSIEMVLKQNNKRFLFPSPNAFAATLLTKYELLKYYGINIDKDERLLYVNSHDSVYKGVARNIGHIGGGIMRTFNNLQDEQSKSKLNIIYKTNPYPSHPIAFKPSLNQDLVKKITKLFLTMPLQMKQTLTIKNFIEIEDKEYQVIRKLAENLTTKEVK